jgi:hypothetical protein
MSEIRKWRRWITTIDRVIVDSIREDKVVFDGYYGLVESNKVISSPWNFHQWALHNHGRSLMLQVRKLVDTDSQAYSLVRLLGQIANCPGAITRRSFVAAYPKHHRDLAVTNWARYVGGAAIDTLPKSVPLRDIDSLKDLSERICILVNKEIAHLDRRRRVRKTGFDEIYEVLRKLVSIGAKYGDLLGRPVADDLDNFVIAYDWMSIFDRRWRKSVSNKMLQRTRPKRRASEH